MGKLKNVYNSSNNYGYHYDVFIFSISSMYMVYFKNNLLFYILLFSPIS